MLPHPPISTTPTVTVVIPTYKPTFLGLTLDSVFQQTWQDFEVLVINDGSPFDIEPTVRPYLADSRLRYITQKNAGAAAARNHGLREAKGEFVAFLDDDDLWLPDKLAWQVEALRSRPELVVVGGGVQNIDSKGQPRNPPQLPQAELGFEDLFGICPFSSPGQTLIRAEELRKIGGFDESIKIANDYDLWIRLSREARIEVRPILCLLYRAHEQSTSNRSALLCRNLLRITGHYLQHAADSSRRQLRSQAYDWIYEYRGRQTLNEGKRDFRAGNFKGAFNSAKVTWQFLRFAVQDRRLFAKLWRDLLPARLVAGK